MKAKIFRIIFVLDVLYISKCKTSIIWGEFWF